MKKKIFLLIVMAQLLNIMAVSATAEERAYSQLLGIMRTCYSSADSNRRNNIECAANAVNGIEIIPGALFSFNEIVGKRTEEAGYLPASVFGSSNPDGIEIGGGVCQVASTIYTAALFADIDIIERVCHRQRVDYIQLGIDAAVTIPEEGGIVQDLKLRNQRSYPVKVICRYSAENENSTLRYLTVEIWGTRETGEETPYLLDAGQSWFEHYQHNYDENASASGISIKLTHETWTFSDEIGSGYRTVTHRKMYSASGELIQDEVLNPQISTGYAMDTYYFE